MMMIIGLMVVDTHHGNDNNNDNDNDDMAMMA